MRGSSRTHTVASVILPARQTYHPGSSQSLPLAVRKKPPTEPPASASDEKIAGHIDGSTPPAKKPSKSAAVSLERVERESIGLFVRERMEQIGAVLAVLGCRPGVVRLDDGSVKVRHLPRELREQAREAIASAGIPRMVSIIALGDDVSAVMAYNALRQTGVALSVSTMDGDGEESSLPAVIEMPPYVPLTPPSDPNQIAVVDAPRTNGHGKREKIERVKKLLPRNSR